MNPEQTPQAVASLTPPQPIEDNTAFQTMIPTKNKYALISYYMGILGLLPFLGIPFSIAAIVLGALGLKKYAINPTPGAKVHAIIGFVLGILQLLTFASFLVLILISKNQN
jgi:hypothetical protein